MPCAPVHPNHVRKPVNIACVHQKTCWTQLTPDLSTGGNESPQWGTTKGDAEQNPDPLRLDGDKKADLAFPKS